MYIRACLTLLLADGKVNGALVESISAQRGIDVGFIFVVFFFQAKRSTVADESNQFLMRFVDKNRRKVRKLDNLIVLFCTSRNVYHLFTLTKIQSLPCDI